MTTNRVDLKAKFRDGEVPTGDNFATLIDSMVHVDEFQSWRKTGEIDLANGAWRVYVDSSGRFVVDPDNPTLSRPPLALWHEGGWVGMQGRIGTYDPAREAASENKPSELQVPLNVRADGKWQPVVSNLEGCHAFELVAQVADPQKFGKQGVTRAVALTSSSGSDLSIQQAPAHRTLRRNLITLALLALLLALILGLPQEFVEKGRVGNEAVKNASALVEKRDRELGKLKGIVSSDDILLYREKSYGGGGRVVIDLSSNIVNVDDVNKVKSIFNNFSSRVRITVFSEPDGKGTPTVYTRSIKEIPDKVGIKSAKVSITPEFQKRIDKAQSELDRAKEALEKANQTPILARYVERLLPFAKPGGMLGIVVVAISLLISHLRHRSAIRVKWRKHRNKLIGGDVKYDLCLRTGRAYGVDASGVPVAIHYHIAKPWG